MRIYKPTNIGRLQEIINASKAPGFILSFDPEKDALKREVQDEGYLLIDAIEEGIYSVNE